MKKLTPLLGLFLLLNACTPPTEEAVVTEPPAEALSLSTCTQDLAENSEEHDFWVGRMNELFPSLSVIRAGALCELSDGNKLVSYVIDDDKNNQFILRFDKDNTYLDSSQRFNCYSFDTAPHSTFRDYEEGILTVTCEGDDGFYYFEEDFEIDWDALTVKSVFFDSNYPEEFFYF